MTRDEAVSQFQREGFRAFKRDWSMGETIGVGILKPNCDDNDIESFTKLVYVFPIKDQWGIHAPNILASTDYSRRYPFEAACDLARLLLQCEFLPFQPQSILIHHIRGEGGGSQMMEHVPTGTRKQLTEPGGKILCKRSEALDELAFELAFAENKKQNKPAHPTTGNVSI